MEHITIVIPTLNNSNGVIAMLNALVAKYPSLNVIVVDDVDSRGVTFNEYETIFDMGDDDGHHMQPTTFPELENRPPEEEDEDESLKILDDIGEPLGDGDLDDIGGETITGLDDFDELN